MMMSILAGFWSWFFLHVYFCAAVGMVYENQAHAFRERVLPCDARETNKKQTGSTGDSLKTGAVDAAVHEFGGLLETRLEPGLYSRK